MVICESCGYEYNDDLEFCTKCGHPNNKDGNYSGLICIGVFLFFQIVFPIIMLCSR